MISFISKFTILKIILSILLIKFKLIEKVFPQRISLNEGYRPI